MISRWRFLSSKVEKMQYNATFAMTGVISGTSKKKTLPRTTFSKDAGMGNF